MTTEDVERVTGGPNSELVMLKSLSVLRLEPGDVLVFKVDRRLSPSTYTYIHEIVEEVWPGTKAIVLEAGMDVGVVRRTIADPNDP